jgi:tight adherence protein C
MLLLISVVAFLTVFTLLYLMLSTYTATEGQVSLRLKALDTITAGRSDIDDELARPFSQRVLSPLTGSMATGLGRLTPTAVRRTADEKLAAAGGFAGLSTDGFLLLWGGLVVSLPALTGFFAGVAGTPVSKIIGLATLAFCIGAALPLFLLRRRIAARKASIEKDLPDVLDLLTVSVEAGLGFDGALAKLSEKMNGALVEEFSRVLQEIRIGVPRRESLHALGRRCDVADLSLFTSALVQADQLGVSIGSVLRVQSAAMREKRRQLAQERAMKAPVKMLLPLVLCIFPTLFVILLGPALIQILTSFANSR